MFHVLLGLPVLAAFGAVAGVVLFLMGLILAFAFFGQLLLLGLWHLIMGK